MGFTLVGPSLWVVDVVAGTRGLSETCHCYAARFSSTSARRAATLAALYNCTVHSDATVSPVAGGGAPAAHRQDAEGVLHRHELRLHSLEARRQRARHQYEDGAAHRRGRN